MSYFAGRCVVALVVGFSLFVGCDNTSETASPGTDTKAKVADAGKPVAKADQLLGSWFRQGETADPVGLEFASDGKVMVYGTGGFALIGEATLPVVQDLNSAAGREFFGLDEADLAGVSVVTTTMAATQDSNPAGGDIIARRTDALGPDVAINTKNLNSKA